MEKLNERLSRYRSGSHILRAVAGGYLLYLAYGIFTDSSADKPAAVMIFAALFVLFGLVLGLSSVYALCTGRYLEQKQIDEAEAPEAEEDESEEADEYSYPGEDEDPDKDEAGSEYEE